MFVILVYDVAQKRSARVRKCCQRYLHHVQRSVFEGELTQAQLEALKRALATLVVVEHDAICIYKIGSQRYTSKDCLGCVCGVERVL